MKKKVLKLHLLIVFFVSSLNAQTCYYQEFKLNIENALGFSSTLKEPNVGILFIRGYGCIDRHDARSSTGKFWLAV